MKAKTFDEKFDAGEKIVDQLDLGKARRVGTDPRRVNVDFPAWMVLPDPGNPQLDERLSRHAQSAWAL